jgi:4-hydroxybenzoate polyprenyltransferase
VAGRGPGTLWVVLAVLAGQLFVGWTNDYLDRDRDRAAQRADKPVARGEIEPRIVGVAAIVALVAAVPLSLASGLAAAGVHFVGLASATAYNLRLKATVLSFVPYAVSFSLVPAFITLGLTPSHWPPAWVTTAAALIGVGGHFAQARPDVEHDRRQRIFGVPQRVGDRASALLAALFLAAAATVIAAASRNPLPLVALVPCAAVALTPPRLSFRLTLATALLTATAFVLIAGRSA